MGYLRTSGSVTTRCSTHAFSVATRESTNEGAAAIQTTVMYNMYAGVFNSHSNSHSELTNALRGVSHGRVIMCTPSECIT